MIRGINVVHTLVLFSVITTASVLADTTAVNYSSFEKKVGIVLSEFVSEKGETEFKSCTATLVGRQHILTAASCLFSSVKPYKKAYSLHFYPGLKQSNQIPYGRYPIVKSYVTQTYYRESLGQDDDENNLALAELGQGFGGKVAGDVVGWMGIWGKKTTSDGAAATLAYTNNSLFKTRQFSDDCQLTALSDKQAAMSCVLDDAGIGAPMIRFSKEHGVNYVLGVVTSVPITYSNGARLNPIRQQIFTDITNGKYAPQNNKEKFVEISHPQPDRISVLVTNACSETLLAAVHMQDYNKKWRSIGGLTLKAGETALFGHTRNTFIYFSGTYDDGESFVNRHDNSFDLEDGRGEDIPFEERESKDYGDYIYTFHCD